MWLVTVEMEDMPIITHKYFFKQEVNALRKALELKDAYPNRDVEVEPIEVEDE